MPDDILVFVEHQGGKVSRPAWEALAAGQQLARDMGAGVSAVLIGGGISALASEVAAV
jgi:electron transfer flavoprotein alpha subunit